MKRLYWFASLPIVPKFIKRFVEMNYWNKVADVKNGDIDREKWNAEKRLSFFEKIYNGLIRELNDKCTFHDPLHAIHKKEVEDKLNMVKLSPKEAKEKTIHTFTTRRFSKADAEKTLINVFHDPLEDYKTKGE
jgi:hypothetical protein